MTVLLDTNVIIDNFAIREPYYINANRIFTLITEENITGYISTSSITDVYYLLRKSFNDTESRIMIESLLNLFQVVEVTKNDCFIALASSMSDFEDSLVVVCANRANVDFIITRDVELLKTSNTISPSEFLMKFNGMNKY